ncbi:molybdopterin-binding protein [Nocardioides convexus]|uniref:molybdopterin-binding protein n=1 Tax=Nocardioides convexus TaxID=2712224 RepID=UPI0031015EB3
MCSRPVPSSVAGHVPDSNSATLLAAGEAVGAAVCRFGPVADDLGGFRAALAEAAAVSDLVVTTGGISAGDHDVVKAALREEPGFWFGPVAMKPGRPQGCGVLEVAGRRVPVVTLPGTPVAAYASFLLYVFPALRALAGLPQATRTAPLARPVEAGDRTVLLPGRYDDRGRIAPLPGRVGHAQALLARADALLVVPASDRVVPEGAPVEVLALHPEEDGHG